MLLNEDEITENLKNLENWTIDENQITKSYRLKDFIEAIGFVNKIAILAEKADHHPDILIQYAKVKISLSTHSEGGITEKDFKLAQQIEKLV